MTPSQSIAIAALVLVVGVGVLLGLQKYGVVSAPAPVAKSGEAKDVPEVKPEEKKPKPEPESKPKPATEFVAAPNVATRDDLVAVKTSFKADMDKAVKDEGDRILAEVKKVIPKNLSADPAQFTAALNDYFRDNPIKGVNPEQLEALKKELLADNAKRDGEIREQRDRADREAKAAKAVQEKLTSLQKKVDKKARELAFRQYIDDLMQPHRERIQEKEELYESRYRLLLEEIDRDQGLSVEAKVERGLRITRDHENFMDGVSVKDSTGTERRSSGFRQENRNRLRIIQLQLEQDYSWKK